MTVETDLLRMLEPAVRPDGVTGSVRPRPETSQPIESRSFESILGQVQAQATEGDVLGEAGDDQLQASTLQSKSAGQGSGNGLQELARLDRIENASLMNVLGQGGVKESR